MYLLETFSHPLAIIDVETTGTHGRNDRIIEIGILRVENGSIVEQFNTLLNPHIPISPFITAMTGIHKQDLLNAPSFEDIKYKIWPLFEDALFVAHNARFDYGFIKNEFKRTGTTFTANTFCSAQFSRMLFPQHHRHNIDSIINRYNLACANRHRALDDARVIYDFFSVISDIVPENITKAAITKLIKHTSVPIHLTHAVSQLPEAPGVYLFYGEDNSLLYIGKSTNIKNRVQNHFASDHSSPQEAKLAAQTTRIDYIQTAGELSALLLEARLIKEQFPLYNKALRKKNRIYAIEAHPDEHGYLNLTTTETDSVDAQNLHNLMAICNSKQAAKSKIERVRKQHTLCKKLCGLEKVKGACFGYQLEQCLGACVQEENTESYNERVLEGFAPTRVQEWPFRGAVAITETASQIKTTIVCNNWRIHAEISHDEETTTHRHHLDFDYESYQILKRFFKQQEKKALVRRLSESELKQILNEHD